MKSTFDPTLFGFSKTDRVFTFKSSEFTYEILFFKSKNEEIFWSIHVSNIVNNKNYFVYIGNIPDNDFGFQLLKNTNLKLPIVQRHSKIEDILQ